jgi:hypothetical protein
VMMKKTSSATTMNATSSSLKRPPVAPLHVQFVVCIASDAPRVYAARGRRVSLDDRVFGDDPLCECGR